MKQAFGQVGVDPSVILDRVLVRDPAWLVFIDRCIAKLEGNAFTIKEFVDHKC